MEKHFVRRGVKVIIPDQGEREFEIEDKLHYDEDLMYKTEGFELVRLVINLGVTEQKSRPNEPILFDQGKEMELVVALTSADLAHLDEEHPEPKLAYWRKGDPSKWVDLNATVDADKSMLTATTDHWWPDPGLGVGR
jgi:hypothetical protein